MEKVETIAVKVKTMDEAIFDYQVATTDKIMDLKEKILSVKIDKTINLAIFNKTEGIRCSN